MGWVSAGRWLDSAIMGIFLMVISALSLYIFGSVWELVIANPNIHLLAMGMQKLFPFKRTFDVNLTHILLFAIVICFLSLRPDYEAEQAAQAVESQRRGSTTRAEGSDKKSR
eukprot:Selendium_serpulae@DN5661_c0_g1_i1.p1